MKKLMALLMGAALMLSLAACAGDNETDTDADTTAAVVNEETDASENSSDTEAETEEKEDNSSKKITRGTIDGDVYTNDFMNFTFTKPADWRYLSDEEIAQTVNVGSEVLDLNSLEEALSSTASIYDMCAVNATGTENVMLCYENTMLTAFRQLTADEYIEAVKQQLSSVTEYEYTYGETEDATISDLDFRKVNITSTINGFEISQSYYVRAEGKYIVAVIATYNETPIETIEAMFN